MKIRLTEEKYNLLKQSIETSSQPNSLPIETSEEWKKYITKPVIKHMLAPRQARVILDLFGIFGDFGMNITNIIEDLLQKYVKKTPIHEDIVKAIILVIPNNFKIGNLKEYSVEQLEKIYKKLCMGESVTKVFNTLKIEKIDKKYHKNENNKNKYWSGYIKAMDAEILQYKQLKEMSDIEILLHNLVCTAVKQLEEATQMISDWGVHTDPSFQKKYNLKGDVEKIQKYIKVLKEQLNKD